MCVFFMCAFAAEERLHHQPLSLMEEENPESEVLLSWLGSVALKLHRWAGFRVVLNILLPSVRCYKSNLKFYLPSSLALVGFLMWLLPVTAKYLPVILSLHHQLILRFISACVNVVFLGNNS